VKFLGRVSDETLRTCYQAADVCVVPSVELEGYGLVVLEALACGAPVVGTDVGGLPEALSALDPSLVVAAGDAQALARRLEEAQTRARPLPSRPQCRRYAEAFAWETVAARNRDVYARALAPRAPDKLRVVYLDHCAQLSGGEIALLRLLPALGEVDAHVILAEEGPLVSRLLGAGISVEVLPMAEPARELRRGDVRPGSVGGATLAHAGAYTARLAVRLRRIRPDLVHTNSLKAALYGGVAAKLSGVPVVFHARDRLSSDYLPAAAVHFMRRVSRRVPDAIVAVSTAVKDTWAVGAQREGCRTVVIRDPLVAPQLPRRRAPAPRVGVVGRIAPWKGQHVFLEAFAQAFPDGPERAVIVGAPLFGEEAYEQSLRVQSARLGLNGRTEFTGFREDVWPELAALDVLVHCSVVPEPGGQAVAEGMAAGLPVVATTGGGPSEMIEDGVSGLLYPPGDAQALGHALRTLIADAGMRRRLGDSARERAKPLAPEVAAQHLMELYRRTVTGPPGGAGRR
jgi:glycosyltransferase involved in cell wall biosynthesis